MSTSGSEPAFPVPNYVNASGETHASQPSGMSLRDWFAGRAMAALVGSYRNSVTQVEPNDIRQTETQKRTMTTPWDDLIIDGGDGCTEIAEQSYMLADAMLAARKAAP